MPLIHLELLPRKISKSDILAFLQSTGQINRRDVGRIELRPGEATIEVPMVGPPGSQNPSTASNSASGRIRAWADQPASSTGPDQEHFARLVRLLDLESRAEARQAAQRGQRMSAAEAERSGTSLVDLVIVDEDTGLAATTSSSSPNATGRHCLGRG